MCNKCFQGLWCIDEREVRRGRQQRRGKRACGTGQAAPCRRRRGTCKAAGPEWFAPADGGWQSTWEPRGPARPDLALLLPAQQLDKFVAGFVKKPKKRFTAPPSLVPGAQPLAADTGGGGTAAQPQQPQQQGAPPQQQQETNPQQQA
jgi:hypothetical protein